MARRSKFSREVRERAVALVFEQVGQYGSQWEAIVSIAGKVGASGESLRRWVRQAEVEAGARVATTASYQASVEGLVAAGYDADEARRLIRLSVGIEDVEDLWRDLDRALQLAARLDTGMIRVNAPTPGVDYLAPFGGEKDSSYGPREQGQCAVEFYTTVKTAYVFDLNESHVPRTRATE